jgi:DNA polymerase-3 subunit alpha
MIEVIAFPDLYKTAATLIVSESLIRVTGTIDRADKGTRLKGTKIESLADLQTRGITRVKLRVAEEAEPIDRLALLQAVFQRHPGHATICFTFCLTNVEAETAPLPNLSITPSEGFVAEVEEVLGKGAVALL